jgi:TolB-like protein/class 3 adenylate cyclase/Tfp pilus assembly protein PilF
MEKDQLSRKLAVILHADVVGSTTLVQQNEALAHERIQGAFNRFSEIIESYTGITRELRGDAILAEFDRASDAVSAALTFQISNRDFNSNLNDDIQPRLRIGVSLGEVVIADNTITGAGVVLAQRVEQLADPDGLCITAALHEALPKHMPFELDDLGEQMLKGFDDQVHVYKVSVSSGQSIPPPEQNYKVSPSSSKWHIVTSAVIALVVTVVLLYFLAPWKTGTEKAQVDIAVPQADKLSIAVLPFTNMSNDAEQEYFVDGMTEDVITDLSKLSGLFVIARNSILTYKDNSPDIQQVAEELGVKYILQGSVRRAGDQLRINAQLVNTENGKHLWAERYDRQLQGIFAIQDEIAASIVQALKIQLGAKETEALQARATINFEAYDLFLKGQRSFSSRTRENISEAISLYRKAIELDPAFSRAYGATAVAMTFQYRRGFTDTPLETMNLALELAQRATAMSSNIPQVYWSLGYVQLFRKEYDKAARAVQNAIQISPNYADAYGLLALIYNHQGNSNEAIENITKGMKLNPYYSYDYPYNLGRAQYLAGRYEEAIDNLNKALEKNETAPTPRIYLIASYVKAGMIDDAEWEAENLQTQNPEMTISQLRRTSAQKETLMDELALDLRKAGVPD